MEMKDIGGIFCIFKTHFKVSSVVNINASQLHFLMFLVFLMQPSTNSVSSQLHITGATICIFTSHTLTMMKHIMWVPKFLGF